MTYSRFRPCGVAVGVALVSSALAACSNPASPTPTRSVELVLLGPVNLKPELRVPVRPTSLDACVSGVAVTRVHPSWRDYEAVPMSATLALDAWRFTFTDVPVGETVRFRINDKNWCDQNATGAVLRDVSANGVVLTQNTTTPGASGTEPGFAFTVDATGQVRQ
jgi:uncharacterized repeat protein (TIGR01451 family)